MARPEFKRRTGLLDDAVVEGQIAHDLANAVKGDELVGELLHVDPVVELFEGDWSRTGVAQASQGIKGPAPTFFGEGVAQVDRVIGIARTEGLKQLALDSHADEIENDVIGQLDGVDELTGGFESIAIDEFQQKAHQVDFVDAGGADIGWLGGDAMQEGIELFLGDSADGNEIVAEPAAVIGHAHERFGNVAIGDELCADQQIP